MSSSQNCEAMTAVKMAKQSVLCGQIQRADKLFRHALSICPNDCQVLLPYGEFLESLQDFRNADHFYFKTLLLTPNHPVASENRKRVLPIVNQLDVNMCKRIDEKKSRLCGSENSNPFLHMYHTLAIEGNTMTAEQVENFLKRSMRAPGKSPHEHNEALGIRNAFHYVYNTLVHKKEITVPDLLEIHRNVMEYSSPRIAGTFRKIQVYVGRHKPPAVVGNSVHELVALLPSWFAENRHPVWIAALAHQRLVHIHPFEDGNGRTTRLFMNWIFHKFGYPAVLIKKEDTPEYFQTLDTSNGGDVRPFFRFIAHATERTLDDLLKDVGSLAETEQDME